MLEDCTEDWVHQLFVRYGRGRYLGPVCEVQAKKAVKFKCSAEYCDGFGYVIASCGGEFDVKGALYSTLDFRDELSQTGVPFDDKSKEKKGYFVAEINETLPGDVLASIYSAAPHASALLNLKGEAGKLKCKKKPPKPGKEKDAGFGSGSFTQSGMEKLMQEILFDVEEGFKSASVENTYVIDELLIPEGMSASEARVNAKRKGTLERKVEADGQEKKVSKDFTI